MKIVIVKNEFILVVSPKNISNNIKLYMITEEQTQDIEYCKKTLINEVEKINIISDKLKEHLTHEILISIIYLKIFSAYLQEKKFENLEEAWRFMNDMKTIIEKIFYVNSYLLRKKESLKAPVNA